MTEEIDDPLSVQIGEKLRVLSPISSDRGIYKVPEHLRMVNKGAYEPHILAIGPYHRGKNHLNAMEEHKKRYLKKLLQRRGEDNVTRYITAMRTLEGRTRDCYAESVSLETDEFVEMMLLDGCFIVELLRKCTRTEMRDGNDPVFKIAWIVHNVVNRDLFLVENQLPFFVLLELFRMTSTPDEPCFGLMIFRLFSGALPTGNRPTELLRQASEDCFQHTRHLAGLLHDSWLPMRQATEENWENIRCATKLREAGIQFKKVETDNLFAIEFENGIMEIPRLKVVDRTETFFRNLIAYEQFFLDENLNYATDYVTLLDCLIDSQKDVELLCQYGIIHNGLGDDEAVANMFNRLCDSVLVSPSNFGYAELFNDVNAHCGRRWNKWMATLCHNYFNTPWAFISFLGALLLLLLTLVQTVFSVLACFK